MHHDWLLLFEDGRTRGIPDESGGGVRKTNVAAVEGRERSCHMRTDLRLRATLTVRAGERAPRHTGQALTPVIVSMSSIDSTPGRPVVASPTSFGSPLPQVRLAWEQ